jgi:RNA polymerase sigma-70 factor (ECF subfamily)
MADSTSISFLDRLRQQPDEDAWKRLVDVYTPLLHAWLRRWDVQPSDADDLIQEVLSVLHRELPQFEHSQQKGAFRRWLRTILVHRLRDAWRARRYRPDATGKSDFLQQLAELEDPASGLSQIWDRDHNEHVVRRLLEVIEPEFAPRTWQAFRRQVVDGAEPDTVAAELGLSLNAVFIAKSRVLSRLRQEGAGWID